MELAGIHHVSLNVRDHTTAAAFYRDVLGLTDLQRPDFGFPGSWFAFPDGRQVHLIEAADFDPPAGPHFAIRVDDIEVAVAELRGRGVDVGDPSELPGGVGGRQAFFTDPSGNLLELNQPT